MKKLLYRLAVLRPLAMVAGWCICAFSALQSGALTFWAFYWFSWFFIGFVPPEMYWVFNNPANTLSDNTWRFESLDFKHPFMFSEWTSVHWVFAVVFTLLMTWLWVHLIFGQLR